MLEHQTLGPHPTVTQSPTHLPTQTNPTFATWRGEKQQPIGLLATAWKLLHSTPVAFQVVLLLFVLLNVPVPLLVPAQLGLVERTLNLLAGGEVHLRGVKSVDGLKLTLLVIRLLSMCALLPIILWAMRISLSWTQQRCQELVDPDAPCPQELVRVSVSRDGITIGSDVGTSTIIDEMLVFQGQKTHFALTSEFVSTKPAQKDVFSGRKLSPSYARSVTLKFSGGGHEFKVTVCSVINLGFRRNAGKPAGELRDHWAKSPSALGKHCVFPPTVPAPDCYMLAQRVRLLGLLFSSYCVIGAGAVTFRLAEIGATDWSEFLFLCVVVACSSAGASIFARIVERRLNKINSDVTGPFANKSP